jgi:ABC-type transporter lipoprotein component MlaA
MKVHPDTSKARPIGAAASWLQTKPNSNSGFFPLTFVNDIIGITGLVDCAQKMLAPLKRPSAHLQK